MLKIWALEVPPGKAPTGSLFYKFYYIIIIQFTLMFFIINELTASWMSPSPEQSIMPAYYSSSFWEAYKIYSFT